MSLHAKIDALISPLMIKTLFAGRMRQAPATPRRPRAGVAQAATQRRNVR
jgi:hypothetical protein